MKYLSQLLSEVKGEKAHKEAVAMGLKYKGFGYWGDPTTGETKYKTENDSLVPVEQEVVSDKYTGDGVRDIPGQDGQQDGFGNGQAGGSAMDTGAGGGGPQVDPGANIGSAEPGQEIAPMEHDATSWMPGPDGDTCVGPEAQESPAEVPQDSFVGKTNYYKWTAGPDGSNITNIDLNQMKESLSLSPNLNLLDEEEQNSRGDATRAGQAYQIAKQLRGPSVEGEPSFAKNIRNAPTGDRTAGIHAAMREIAGKQYPEVYDPKMNSVVADAARGKERSGYKTFMDRMYGDRDDGNTKIQQAQQGMGILRQYQNDQQQKMRVPDKPASQMADRFRGMAQDQNVGQNTNLYFGKRFASEVPGIVNQAGDRMDFQREKDQKVTDHLNSVYKDGGHFKDPELDLNQELGEDNYLGGGVYGDVYQIEDSQGNPAALKTGKIGPAEFDIMKQMADDPGFPDLLNGQLGTPYANLAAMQQNPLALNGYDDMVNQNHPMGAQALGRFAMEMVPGEPVGEGFGAMDPDGGRVAQDPELMEKMQREFWDLRGRMHREGIAHNDQHMDNVFYDEDSEEMHFIDFGLAQQHPIAALLEGLGGAHEGDYSHPMAGDSQMNRQERWAGFGGSAEDGSAIEIPYASFMGARAGMLPKDLQESLRANVGRVRQKLMDDLGPDAEEFINNVMQGGIGHTNDILDNVGQGLGAHADDEEGNSRMTEDGHNNIMALIDMLYDGVSFAPGERKAIEGAKRRTQATPQKGPGIADQFKKQMDAGEKDDPAKLPGGQEKLPNMTAKRNAKSKTPAWGWGSFNHDD